MCCAGLDLGFTFEFGLVAATQRFVQVLKNESTARPGSKVPIWSEQPA